MFLRTVKNSVDPDQLASEKPADLDLHCSTHDLSKFNIVMCPDQLKHLPALITTLYDTLKNL